MIKFVLRAASTLENTDGEKGALRKFSVSRNLSFIERKRFAPGDLADIVQPIPYNIIFFIIERAILSFNTVYQNCDIKIASDRA